LGAGGLEGGGLVRGGDGGLHFLAENGDLARGDDADLHDVAIDPVDADLDAVADEDRFVGSAGQAGQAEGRWAPVEVLSLS
jgi:hypothetical protein